MKDEKWIPTLHLSNLIHKEVEILSTMLPYNLHLHFSPLIKIQSSFYYEFLFIHFPYILSKQTRPECRENSRNDMAGVESNLLETLLSRTTHFTCPWLLFDTSQSEMWIATLISGNVSLCVIGLVCTTKQKIIHTLPAFPFLQAHEWTLLSHFSPPPLEQVWVRERSFSCALFQILLGNKIRRKEPKAFFYAVLENKTMPWLAHMWTKFRRKLSPEWQVTKIVGCQ